MYTIPDLQARDEDDRAGGPGNDARAMTWSSYSHTNGDSHMISDYRCFDISFEDEVTVLRLGNPDFFNLEEYSELQEELLCFVEELRPPLLVVDFRHVTYCSTAIINGLIHMQQRLVQHGGKLKLSRLSPETHEVFRSLRLDRNTFNICATTGAALVDQ
jgi:anti-anti-sigma regulatory factor